MDRVAVFTSDIDFRGIAASLPTPLSQTKAWTAFSLDTSSAFGYNNCSDIISTELDVWLFCRTADGCARSISALGVARDSEEMDARRVYYTDFHQAKRMVIIRRAALANITGAVPFALSQARRWCVIGGI